MQKDKISIVIPTCNEKKDSYLTKMAARYPSRPDLEYILVDRGTSSQILEQIERPDFRIHSVQAATRGERLNIGLEQATGSLILCHHPRSIVEPEGLEHLIENQNQLNWGGFTHQFDRSSLGLKFTSWYSNNVRPWHSKVLYLDHCIYFKRELLGRPIPNIPIFEDTELSYILAEKGGAPKILPFTSTTSAIRFSTNGFLKQGLMNQRLKLEYHLGRSEEKMNQGYEKNLNLNG